MAGIFHNCSSLKSLEISNWNLNKVTNLESMFSGCESLISLSDISN